MKRQAHTTKIVERLDQNVKLTHVGRPGAAYELWFLRPPLELENQVLDGTLMICSSINLLLRMSVSRERGRGGTQRPTRLPPERLNPDQGRLRKLRLNRKLQARLV